MKNWSETPFYFAGDCLSIMPLKFIGGASYQSKRRDRSNRDNTYDISRKVTADFSWKRRRDPRDYGAVRWM